MPATDYDLVIVGARCAGATLATQVARAGARVLLLDKDAMPSDHVLSTHSVSYAGMAVLDEIGVGDAVRSGSPAGRTLRVCVDRDVMDVEAPGGHPMFCPRRQRLDSLLQEAAVAAGAELKDRARVISLLRDGDRVAGVAYERDGREHRVTAALVVGADGRHSTVARLAGAAEYLGYPAPRPVFWSYWNGADLAPADGYDLYFHLGDEVRALFPTDRAQMLIASSPRLDAVEEWRRDPAGRLRASIASDPVLGPRLGDARPASAIRGVVAERYFFRTATGPGWALVGDAGHHKEYLLGDGITEALLQARGLAVAIHEQRDEALVRWWRTRDVAVLPMYFLGRELTSVRPPLALVRRAFASMERDMALRERMTAVIERRLSPLELLPPAQILAWTMSETLRGRWGVLASAIAATPRTLDAHRELRARQRLLEDCDRPVAA